MYEYPSIICAVCNKIYKGEDEKMRKKIVSILLASLSALMLFGCGAKGTIATEDGETINLEISEKKVAKADTVSEFFGNGKHYACLVRGVVKDTTPIEMYFFEDGKVTKLPGEVYGCTLGELAQMSDDDIWAKYQDARESYETIYLEKKAQGALNGKSTEEIQQALDVLSQINGKSFVELEESGHGDLIELYNNTVWSTLSDLNIAIPGDNYDEPLNATDTINSLSALLNGGLQYYGPFYDQPIKFIIETDGTGNATEREGIWMPSSSEYYDDNGNYVAHAGIENVYTFEVTRGGVGEEQKIYEKNYFCYKGANGNYFCTTETNQLDDPKSKNCLIDPSGDEMGAMFSDIQ